METPWSHAIAWAAARAGLDLHLAANAEARTRVARFLGLEHLNALEGELRVGPWRDGIEVAGRVRAVAGRLCGVTLAPLEETIDEPILIRFAPRGSPNLPADSAEVLVALDGEDPPEEAHGDTLDLAACLVEALSLALDPFPRLPGAAFEPVGLGAAPSPFEALRLLGGGRPDA